MNMLFTALSVLFLLCTLAFTFFKRKRETYVPVSDVASRYNPPLDLFTYGLSLACGWQREATTFAMNWVRLNVLNV